jgi:glycosyltransferase involved in cell wall biosynthesis/putative flippase GtrA
VTHHRFLRFAVVGIVAVGLNLILFAILVGRLGIDYLWATVVVFFLVNGYGFLANRRWVFAVTDRPTRRILRYYATMAASLGLNLLSMAFLVGGLRISYLIASVITSAWLAPVLYLTHDRVAFARKAHRGPRPHVLLVTHYYAEHGGGVEIVAGRLVALLGETLDIEWRAAGERIVEADSVRRPIRSWNGLERRFGLPIPIPSPGGVTALIDAVRAADAVWVHDLIYPANLVAAVTAISTRKPLVVTVHVGAIPYRNPVVRKVMAASLALTGRLLLTRAAAVGFVSERVQAEFLARWKMRRQLLIPNGVDPALFKPLAQPDRDRVRRELGLGDRRMVLFVGRFVERKGLHLLHELATRLPWIEWVFAGRGPLDPDSWRLANVLVERGRSGQALAELYGAADLLVLPSLGEGFPLVVGEALATGLPVLVDPSTIAGYRAASTVVEGEPVTGADAAARWQAHVAAILDHETSDAAAAAARVEFARSNWDWDRAAATYAAVFAEVMR